MLKALVPPLLDAAGLAIGAAVGRTPNENPWFWTLCGANGDLIVPYSVPKWIDMTKGTFGIDRGGWVTKIRNKMCLRAFFDTNYVKILPESGWLKWLNCGRPSFTVCMRFWNAGTAVPLLIGLCPRTSFDVSSTEPNRMLITSSTLAFVGETVDGVGALVGVDGAVETSCMLLYSCFKWALVAENMSNMKTKIVSFFTTLWRICWWCEIGGSHWWQQIIKQGHILSCWLFCRWTGRCGWSSLCCCAGNAPEGSLSGLRCGGSNRRRSLESIRRFVIDILRPIGDQHRWQQIVE